MLVRFIAPNTQPDHGVANKASGEAWIANIVSSGSWRAKWRNLPALWLVIVSAFVFPMGLWNSMEVVGQADEIQTDNSQASHAVNPQNTQAEEQSTPAQAKDAEIKDAEVKDTEAKESAEDVDPIQQLPAIPDPQLGSTRSTPAADSPTKIQVQVIVSGRIFKSEVASGASVLDAIEACNLKLNEHDRVFPAADVHVYNGQKIRITRVRTETKTRTIAVAPQTRYKLTTSLRPGQVSTLQSGSSGQVQLSERIWFKDGLVSGRENLARKVIRAAKDKIVALGSRAAYMPGKVPYHNRYASAYNLASRSGSPRDRMMAHEEKTFRAVRSITLTATGYSPDPSENGGWTTTATGLPIGYGAAAVDPRVVPLGTKMYIEGYGYAFACDTGGAIKGHRIDLAYNSYGEANSKGRKKVRVWILAP
jgi:3D (Asp-Asp-Asp) domain-containing protein/uncharacterized protein YabE (DUF348 family)